MRSVVKPEHPLAELMLRGLFGVESDWIQAKERLRAIHNTIKKSVKWHEEEMAKAKLQFESDLEEQSEEHSVTYTRRAVYEVDYASEDMLCVDRFRIFSTLLLPEKGESKKENINAYMLVFRSVRGEDKIKELEEKAVRLAKKFKGSYAFSFFDRDGNRMLHSRRLYPLEER